MLGLCAGCHKWRVLVPTKTKRGALRPVLRRHEPCGRVHVTDDTPTRPLVALRRTGIGAGR